VPRPGIVSEHRREFLRRSLEAMASRESNMKEEDYILASNLSKLRMAEHILQTIMLPADVKGAIAMIREEVDKHEKAVSDKLNAT
jgi:hypothetical protein